MLAEGHAPRFDKPGSIIVLQFRVEEACPWISWTGECFTCLALLAGQVRQEHKGRASRHTQSMPAPAENAYAWGLSWKNEPAKQSQDKLEKTHGQQAAQAWQEVSAPFTMEQPQPLKPWSFQIAKTQAVQNVHNW